MWIAGAVERQQRVRGQLRFESDDGRGFLASRPGRRAVEHGAVHHPCSIVIFIQSTFDSEATSYQVGPHAQWVMHHNLKLGKYLR